MLFSKRSVEVVSNLSESNTPLPDINYILLEQLMLIESSTSDFIQTCIVESYYKDKYNTEIITESLASIKEKFKKMINFIINAFVVLFKKALSIFRSLENEIDNMTKGDINKIIDNFDGFEIKKFWDIPDNYKRYPKDEEYQTVFNKVTQYMQSKDTIINGKQGIEELVHFRYSVFIKNTLGEDLVRSEFKEYFFGESINDYQVSGDDVKYAFSEIKELRKFVSEIKKKESTANATLRKFRNNMETLLDGLDDDNIRSYSSLSLLLQATSSIYLDALSKSVSAAVCKHKQCMKILKVAIKGGKYDDEDGDDI